MSTKFLVLIPALFLLQACSGDTAGLPGSDAVDDSGDGGGGNSDGDMTGDGSTNIGDRRAEALPGDATVDAVPDSAPDAPTEPAPECATDSDCGAAECLDKCARRVHYCDRGLCHVAVFACECKRKCCILATAACGPSYMRLPKAGECESECSAGACVDVTLAECKCDATYAATCDSATGFCNR